MNTNDAETIQLDVNRSYTNTLHDYSMCEPLQKACTETVKQTGKSPLDVYITKIECSIAASAPKNK